MVGTGLHWIMQFLSSLLGLFWEYCKGRFAMQPICQPALQSTIQPIFQPTVCRARVFRKKSNKRNLNHSQLRDSCVSAELGQPKDKIFVTGRAIRLNCELQSSAGRRPAGQSSELWIDLNASMMMMMFFLLCYMLACTLYSVVILSLIYE